MEEEKVCYLKNWAECEFRSEVIITSIIRPFSGTKLYISTDVDFYGRTYHKSLNAAKSAIRKENSIKSTPKFKWVNY